MNETRANRQASASSTVNSAIVLAVALSLGSAFLALSLPIARAATSTPAEMIEKNLPESMTLAKAPDAAILAALRKAIAQNPKDAPEILRTAAVSRKSLTADMLKTAVSSLQGDKGAANCDVARSTLEQAIVANGEQAASLTELFITLVPVCTDSRGQAQNPAFTNLSNINRAPGSMGGGGSASDKTCTVCHNNRTIQVACSEADDFVSRHPGDSLGGCEASTVTNR
jgi:hypothetical protein